MALELVRKEKFIQLPPVDQFPLGYGTWGKEDLETYLRGFVQEPLPNLSIHEKH